MIIYLLIGGNIGDRVACLDKAKENISDIIGGINHSSSIYESEPWGFNSANLFLNQVLLIESNFKPNLVLEKIKQIETSMGRIRVGNEYSERTIDIDILFYGNEIIESAELIIPHKYIQDRMFVLLPMNEIAPDFIHPVFNKTMSQLIKDCRDKLKVYKFY